MSLTHLSLFSGIGGLDIAAEMAGFETVGQCEWWDFARERLEAHWPGLPRWRDIRTLTGEDFYAKTGLRTVDIISGGFPCQPFSLAGQRRGQADDRYLWPQMLRVVSELRPTWVVGENVAGLVSMVQPSAAARVESRIINRQPDEDFYEAVLSRQEDYLLPQLIGDLERIGYEVQAFVIPACAVGAAHRRDRIALVAHAAGTDAGSGREQFKGEEFVDREQTQLLLNAGGGGGAAAARDYNENVAHADGSRHIHGRDEIHPTETGQHAQCQSLGCGEALAHAQCPERREEHIPCDRLEERQDGVPQGEKSAGRSCVGGQDVADTNDRRWSLRRDGELQSVNGPERKRGHHRGGAAGDVAGKRRSAQPGVGGVADGIPAWMDGYWLSEPDIPRVESGVEDRVDKLKALGNAVYWRQFYPIFAGIHHIEEGQP